MMSFEIYEPLKITTFGGSHLNVYLINVQVRMS